MKLRIQLDRSRLLGFDQVAGDATSRAAGNTMCGVKPAQPRMDGTAPTPTLALGHRIGAKIGAKPGVKPVSPEP